MLNVNINGLFSVFQSFYVLTKIRIVLFDAEFREQLAYPPERETFCALLRKDPKKDMSCRASDQNACRKCAMTKELVLYRCNFGLAEAVVPIFDKNGIFAYVMFGQVIPSESASAVFTQLKREYSAYKDAIDRITVKSSQELSAAATILQAITSHVVENRWVAPIESKFIRQMDQYIDGHLNQSINVDELCVAFAISRMKL